jgi:hypothetical protein
LALINIHLRRDVVLFRGRAESFIEADCQAWLKMKNQKTLEGFSYLLTKPTIITKTIAPRIAEIQPPIPAVPNNHPNRKPPINEPTIPTTMFPII